MADYVPSNKTNIVKTLIENWPEDRKDAVYYRLARVVHAKEPDNGFETPRPITSLQNSRK